MAPGPLQRSTLVITNVHLANDSGDTASRQIYTLVCTNGEVHSIEAVNGATAHDEPTPRVQIYPDATVLDAGGHGISLPSLCHAHIHLDKCLLLPGRCDTLVKGDFQEALEVTARAKASFLDDPEDLYNRGRQLTVESIKCGVTIMRAHVEVDKTVRMVCLDVGLRLQEELRDACDIQVAVFAQDPLFTSMDSAEPGENYLLLCEAARRTGVSAVGSAPYVEPSITQAKKNIDLILDIAYEKMLHADFHLDYNLDPASEPLVWYLLSQLRGRIREGRWAAASRVCVGHATRLTLFSRDEWDELARIIREEDLPLTLVGLPPSDLYMMGRDTSSPPRGTLDVPRLRREHGLRVGMSVNNVGNAFTPQGPIDPLALCPLGIAIFQAGTEEDAKILLESITVDAKTAIQTLESRSKPFSLRVKVGDRADFVLLDQNDTVYEVALRPSYVRTTIKSGVIVAKRVDSSWVMGELGSQKL
ncbi:Metallo-dependent hydrolase [Obba rivulosa]|uniref:Metallo-dependent hydrolase n=1 Tax=Obba rivulosa TaxID=1052685 RepID=A0A8E2DI12_9APHY|nr:Metallo-dependent hydrolase [Obba rivulosa]